MISPEQTENAFDNFFSQLEFYRVIDDVGAKVSFNNADYVHKRLRVVVELKVLEKEHFKEGGVIDSLQAIIVQPRKIDKFGAGQYTFSIPPVNREGTHDSFEEPLRRTLKKANRQLRDTRDYYFRSESSTGIVTLAQTGLSSLDPLVIARLVQKLLEYEFHSIDGIIICTPHYQLRNPLTTRHNPNCVAVARTELPADQLLNVQSLFDELRHYISLSKFPIVNL